MRSAPGPINVRCYSNSDIIVRRSEVTLRGHEETHAPQQISGRLRGAFNAHVDLIAETCKVDRLGQQCLSIFLQRLPFGLRITVGGDHARDKRSRPRQNDPKFGELTGLRIDLYRPAMLLDDDVVTDGQA